MNFRIKRRLRRGAEWGTAPFPAEEHAIWVCRRTLLEEEIDWLKNCLDKIDEAEQALRPADDELVIFNDDPENPFTAIEFARNRNFYYNQLVLIESALHKHLSRSPQ